MNDKFEELILSSGSIKASIFIGGLIELNKYFPLHNFKYLTGCSAGGIIITMLNIGYTLHELKDFFLNIDLDLFQEFKLKNFFNNCGFDNGNKIDNLLKAFFLNKNIDINITFLELYEKTKITLTFNTVNITSGDIEYNNYINTPNMSIILALRMTINIPLIYTPIKYNENLYVDGALLDPFPYSYFKNTKKMGFVIYDIDEYKFINNIGASFINDIDNSFNYIFKIMRIVYANYLKEKYKKNNKNIISFNTDSYDVSFKLEKNSKEKLISLGHKNVRLYFKKIYKLKRKKYLMRKFYILWKLKKLNLKK
jgi:NTE family protein